MVEKFIMKSIISHLNFDEKQIRESESFKELGLDSLDFLEVISDIEDEYSLEFEDTQLANIKNYYDLISTVNSMMG